jgi:para-aminobenzoate synthetase component 1
VSVINFGIHILAPAGTQHITIKTRSSEILFRDKIAAVYAIDMSADKLVSALLGLAATETVCILDSCGVGHLGSHLLIAGIDPVSVSEVPNGRAADALAFLDEACSDDRTASIFTLSYDLGKTLLLGSANHFEAEPAVFLARFGNLIIHDYKSAKTWIAGDPARFGGILERLLSRDVILARSFPRIILKSNFTRDEYLSTVERIRELIRQGDTYQTNLTQQLSATLPAGVTPESIFYHLRRDHPAPFSAFLKRPGSTVVSASPERFFRVDFDRSDITTSPIKGTRPRGNDAAADEALKQELLDSIKDRAENTMIVDLLRNDLGRVCDYGSVEVESLCDLEEHPTFFHLVSTVSGHLRDDVVLSDILRAVFPCGSITGAPKISTMRIIDEIETVGRGLSMGAIGFYVPPDIFDMPETLETSVAIRTLVIRDREVTFNVGGGIVIDSDPAQEYEETLTKAKALLTAINGTLE